MNLAALLFALIIAESLLPLINRILGQNLVLYEALGFRFIPGILLFILMTGTLAGCYPAFYLSSMTISKTYGKSNPGKSSGIKVRKVTVLLQYTLSIAMIICTLLLYKQLYFVRHKDPGFERKNILVIPLPAQYISKMHGLIKEDFLNIPQVEKVAVSSDYPGKGFTKNGYVPEGSSEAAMINVIDGDEDLMDVLGLKMVKGRNFTRTLATDASAYMINETYARSLNWTNPEGKYIYRNGRHEVIGVVKDFNFAPFREKIAPLIFTNFSEGGHNYILVKVKSGQMRTAIPQLKLKWESRLQEVPFDYFYLEEATREIYERERNLSDVILLFTILAIFIAFLGLFGLSTFEAERQTKNIGIRKVNGANSLEILLMLTKEFTRLVLLSFIFACPIAYYFITKWLQQFAYNTNISWWVFLASLVIIMLIALFTVIWQSNRAANRDPVESLRYE
jgi:putative ABC transport system permease protein